MSKIQIKEIELNSSGESIVDDREYSDDDENTIHRSESIILHMDAQLEDSVEKSDVVSNVSKCAIDEKDSLNDKIEGSTIVKSQSLSSLTSAASEEESPDLPKEEHWGTYYWKTLEHIAYNYPDNPNNKELKSAINFYAALQYMLPCDKCKVEYKMLLKITNLKNAAKSRTTLLAWIKGIHSYISEKIKEASYEDSNKSIKDEIELALMKENVLQQIATYEKAIREGEYVEEWYSSTESSPSKIVKSSPLREVSLNTSSVETTSKVSSKIDVDSSLSNSSEADSIQKRMALKKEKMNMYKKLGKFKERDVVGNVVKKTKPKNARSLKSQSRMNMMMKKINKKNVPVEKKPKQHISTFFQNDKNRRNIKNIEFPINRATLIAKERLKNSQPISPKRVQTDSVNKVNQEKISKVNQEKISKVNQEKISKVNQEKERAILRRMKLQEKSKKIEAARLNLIKNEKDVKSLEMSLQKRKEEAENKQIISISNNLLKKEKQKLKEKFNGEVYDKITMRKQQMELKKAVMEEAKKIFKEKQDLNDLKEKKLQLHRERVKYSVLNPDRDKNGKVTLKPKKNCNCKGKRRS